MKITIITILILLIICSPVLALKSGESFNYGSDVHQEEIEFKFKGICVCPKGYYVEEGEIYEYWEPFLLIDTVSEPYYSPYQGDYMGSSSQLLPELAGKNKSSDAVSIADESTFTQAHAWLFPMMYGLCKHQDYGFWMTENDDLWQSDIESAVITPESSSFASLAGAVGCMADSTAVNLANHTLDFMPHCIGSSGMSYPMTGHSDNDNIVQANNLSASRLIYKLNRLFMICDPADNPCGCTYTPVWIKSHYKMHVVRPADRSPAYPVGKSAKFYDSGLNVPYEGEKGSNDEFLWVVYRKQLCCTCCEE